MDDGIVPTVGASHFVMGVRESKWLSEFFPWAKFYNPYSKLCHVFEVGNSVRLDESHT